MPFFRLKAGSHAVGDGANAQFYSANDPQNSIFESDQDLATEFPEKFEEYRGTPPPKRQAARRLPPPPPPPDEAARAAAADLTARTPAEQKSYAQQLRERADALEKAAQEAETNIQQASKDEPPTEAGGESSDDLDSKKRDELLAIAEEEEVDLQGATRKDDIIAAIRLGREQK